MPDGLRALQAQKFKDATEPLTKAIKQSSISTSRDYHNAVMAAAKTRSLDQFFEIKDRNMYLINSYIARGIANSSLNENKKAIEDFSSAQRAFSFSAKAMCNRGRTYMKMNMPQEALKDLNAAIAIAPELVEAYANRAIVYRVLQQPGKSEQDLKKVAELRKKPDYEYVESAYHRDRLTDDALKQDPSNYILLTDKGFRLSHENLDTQAIPVFKKAIQSNSKFVEAYGGLTDCYLAQENFEAALATAKQAEKISPNDKKVLMRMAVIYQNTDRLKEAEPYFRRILKFPAKEPEEFRFRALCYLSMKEPRLGLAESEKCLQLAPQMYRSWDDKALCLCDLKRYTEAIQAENRAIKLKPNFATSYIHRAQIQARMHNLDAAEADLERALAIDPKDKAIYRIKGAVEAMKGNLELSVVDGQTGNSPFKRSVKGVSMDALKKEIASYSHVISTIPSQPAPFYDRAVLYIASEKLSEGISDLRTYLKLSKWSGRAASYAASLLALALRESGQSKEADQVLKNAARSISTANSVPILDLLSGRSDEQTLLKTSSKSNVETRDRLLLGIHLWQQQKISEAQKQLDWVLKKGDQNIDEYVLVSTYLRKVAFTPRRELRQFDSQ